jgi:hypothetical protein
MTTKTYTTPGSYTLVVPDQCTSITVDVKGAGGPFTGDGAGGRVAGVLSVLPGDVLHIYVGGVGHAPADSNTGGAGGFNGGGAGGNSLGSNTLSGYGGSGASDIRKNGTALSNRVCVAGGAGSTGRTGTGTKGSGGAGGSTTGAAGGAGGGGEYGGGGGGGGTQTAGGAAGAIGSGTAGLPGAGTLGAGGHGSGHTGNNLISGGAGGGGYYGGGGGGGANRGFGSSGGGGGGSNYTGGLASTTANTRGGGSAQGHNGSVTLTYNVAPSAPTLALPSSLASALSFPVDEDVDISVTHNDPDGGPMSRMDYRYRFGSGAWTEIDLPAATLVSGSTYRFTISADTFDSSVDLPIELQARTYDSLSAVSPWSDSGYLVARDHPDAATITTPVTGDLITSGFPTVSWTTPAPMVAYQLQAVRVVDGVTYAGGTALVDGEPTALSAAFPAPYVDHDFYHFNVRWQQYPGVWSGWATSDDVEANLTSPLQPSLILTPVPSVGAIRVQVVNPGSDPHPPDHNLIYRSDLDHPTEAEVLIATDVPVNGVFIDASPASRHTYRYRVEAVTVTGSVTSSE